MESKATGYEATINDLSISAAFGMENCRSMAFGSMVGASCGSWDIAAW